MHIGIDDVPRVLHDPGVTNSWYHYYRDTPRYSKKAEALIKWMNEGLVRLEE